MTDPLVFVLATLATARGTRLITTDDICTPLRSIGPAWLRDALVCPWCVSMWVAAAVVVLVALAPGAATWLLAVPALSWAAAWLEDHG